jgi:hypothetical protein
MKALLHRLKIHTLKGQVALRQLRCASLAQRIETQSLTAAQETELTRWQDESLEENHILQLEIDLLERQEKEELGGTDSPISEV